MKKLPWDAMGAIAQVIGVLVAIVGILVAVFGVVIGLLQWRFPIDATNLEPTPISTRSSQPTMTISTVPSPTTHVYLTPYQDAFIELISVVPDTGQPLLATKDVPYSYKIRYFVPEFDWNGAGIEPRVQLERVVSEKAGLETVVLNDIGARIGKPQTVDIKGRFIVPSDREKWVLRVKVIFLTDDGGGLSGGNLVLPIMYSITSPGQ